MSEEKRKTELRRIFDEMTVDIIVAKHNQDYEKIVEILCETD